MGDGCCYAVSALLISVAVGLFGAVCFPAGVVVWPSHQAFAFDGGEPAYGVTVWLGGGVEYGVPASSDSEGWPGFGGCLGV